MEGYFEKIFYLLVAIIWYVTKRSSEKPIQRNIPGETVSQPELATGREVKKQEAQLPKALVSTATHRLGTQAYSTLTSSIKPSRGTKSFGLAPHPSSQLRKPKKAGHLLSRYNGWRKAIVMAEVMRPSSHVSPPVPYPIQ